MVYFYANTRTVNKVAIRRVVREEITETAPSVTSCDPSVPTLTGHSVEAGRQILSGETIGVEGW